MSDIPEKLINPDTYLENKELPNTNEETRNTINSLIDVVTEQDTRINALVKLSDDQGVINNSLQRELDELKREIVTHTHPLSDDMTKTYMPFIESVQPKSDSECEHKVGVFVDKYSKESTCLRCDAVVLLPKEDKSQGVCKCRASSTEKGGFRVDQSDCSIHYKPTSGEDKPKSSSEWSPIPEIKTG